MIKELLTFVFMSGCLFVGNPNADVLPAPFEPGNFIVETKENGKNILLDVVNSSLTDMRIYAAENIDEISEGAFDDCLNLESLMISYTITILPDSLFSSPENHVNFFDIFYTGSETEWELVTNYGVYNDQYDVHFDAFDEGFIRMWNREVRPGADISICDIGIAGFSRVMSLYENLSETDRETVNDTVDFSGEDTIGESIIFLSQYFAQENSSYSDNREVSSSTMISFVIVVAVIGMTFIMVFYYLKDKQIIE